MRAGLPYLLVFGWGMFFSVSISISSAHWLGMWAGAELNLIMFIPFLIYTGLVSETESAMKYFIFQAIGSGFMVFGSVMTYSMTHSWELITDIHVNWMLFVGLMVKLGAAPFHWWLPPVMAGVKWPVAFILTTWQKIIPLFLVCTLLGPDSWQPLVMFLSVASGFIGGIGGVNQTQFRALIAYSSIGHIGWMLYSMSFSLGSMVIYFLFYVAISAALFRELWNMASSGTLDTSGNHSVMVNLGIMVSLVSMGGLPPMVGLFPKWLIFIGAWGTAHYMVILLLILGSLISIYYYLCVVFSLIMIFKGKGYHDACLVLVAILANIVLGVLCMFLF
uniref:NADH-ubiquinone oxidoreductase chain 2 n=1 Tax=Thylacodes squamigerus TaxID=766170 RepID=E2FLU9_9CAEN|nr:NADH dehydrogenase subunit 2 [Thylacodes squamigerus]ADI79415.1 NADH dehydrogenase subunit 2 [Thylacodes squamigerus]